MRNALLWSAISGGIVTVLYFRLFFTKKTSKILAIIKCGKKFFLFDKLHDNYNDDNDNTNDSRDTRLLYSVSTKPTTGCPQKNKANYFFEIGVIKQQLKALIFKRLTLR